MCMMNTSYVLLHPISEPEEFLRRMVHPTKRRPPWASEWIFFGQYEWKHLKTWEIPYGTYIYIYIHMYVLIYMYIYIYVYVCIDFFGGYITGKYDHMISYHCIWERERGWSTYDSLLWGLPGDGNYVAVQYCI
jgi:hypothetical protein